MPGALSVVLSLRPLLKLSVDSLGCYKVSSLLLHSSPKVIQLLHVHCIIHFHFEDNIFICQPKVKIHVALYFHLYVLLECYFKVLLNMLECSSLVLCIIRIPLLGVIWLLSAMGG